MSRRRRALWTALCIFAVVPASGALYQWISVRREAGRYPPPGQLIDVGGRRLHVVCLGQGDRTVVFESSGFGGATSSQPAREELSAHARVCSYDRAGMGWSDPGPPILSAGVLAEDLLRLAGQAGLTRPFVLVAASVGGLTAELFARRHPEQVAGLVMVDAANSAILERIEPEISWMHIRGACLAPAAARLGLLRLLDPFRAPSAQDVAMIYRVEPMTTLCGIVRGMRTSIAELAAAPLFRPDLPVTVLIHDKPYGLLPPGVTMGEMVQEWPGLQRRFAGRIPRATSRVVPGSGHLMGSTHPHAVAEAVWEVIGRR